MNTLELDCPGVISNDGGVTVVAVNSCTNGDAPPTDPVFGSFIVVPLILEQCPDNFLV